jgi:hypothetical protein
VEIDKMAARLARDEGWSKLKALSVLHSRWRRIIDREESKP